jgi:hypothetical protein
MMNGMQAEGFLLYMPAMVIALKESKCCLKKECCVWQRICRLADGACQDIDSSHPYVDERVMGAIFAAFGLVKAIAKGSSEYGEQPAKQSKGQSDSQTAPL